MNSNKITAIKRASFTESGYFFLLSVSENLVETYFESVIIHIIFVSLEILGKKTRRSLTNNEKLSFYKK